MYVNRVYVLHPLEDKGCQQGGPGIYAKFWGSKEILSDNGTEFKNQLFMDVAAQLGVECRVYSPPYHPQSNGRSEGFDNFL